MRFEGLGFAPRGARMVPSTGRGAGCKGQLASSAVLGENEIVRGPAAWSLETAAFYDVIG